MHTIIYSMCWNDVPGVYLAQHGSMHLMLCYKDTLKIDEYRRFDHGRFTATGQYYLVSLIFLLIYTWTDSDERVRTKTTLHQYLKLLLVCIIVCGMYSWHRFLPSIAIKHCLHAVPCFNVFNDHVRSVYCHNLLYHLVANSSMTLWHAVSSGWTDLHSCLWMIRQFPTFNLINSSP